MRRDAFRPTEGGGAYRVGVMRLILAAAALLIVSIDPPDPHGYDSLTYVVLVLYAIYSVALLAFPRARRVDAVAFWPRWADTAWYCLLIAVSGGTNSAFFGFLLFPILVTSSRLGFNRGLMLAVGSSMLFTVIAHIATPAEMHFELDRFLLRPMLLLVLGFIIASQGGSQVALMRRLTLLKEINKLSNPRFGVGRTIGSNMERLRAFYDADWCLSIAREDAGGDLQLRRVGRTDPDAACHSEAVPAEVARQLLAPPAERAILYAPRGRWIPFTTHIEIDVGDRMHPRRGNKPAAAVLAEILDASCFISIPLSYENSIAGRLYLTAGRPIFRPSDLGFLLQVVAQVAPVLDNIRLVDHMASGAAAEERQRIAHDLHDSVIQPYLALKIGLASVRETLLRGVVSGGDAAGLRELLAGSAGRLQDLMDLADAGAVETRGLFVNLRATAAHEESLIRSLERLCASFSHASGISTVVEADGPMHVNDRLGAEVLQMVAEGLSNIRRHTSSMRAVIRLGSAGGQLSVRIENSGDGNGSSPGDFTPRSIRERAEALQGRAGVERLDGGGSAVTVEIPL